MARTVNLKLRESRSSYYEEQDKEEKGERERRREEEEKGRDKSLAEGHFAIAQTGLCPQRL